MDVDGCLLAEDRLYDIENDVWFHWADDGRTARIGLLGSLASFAGKILTVGFRDVTGVVARGRSVGTIESIRYTGAVRIPVDATVVRFNAELRQRPKLINDSPYERGWFAEIAPAKPPDVARQLESASSIRDRLHAKIQEFRIRCYPAAPDLEMFEIGAECAAILARLDDELSLRAPDDVVLLITDDPTSPIEMVRWSDRTGYTVLDHRQEGSLHHFLIRKEAHPTPRRRGLNGATGSA